MIRPASVRARELVADGDGNLAHEKGSRPGQLKDDEVHDDFSGMSGARSVRLAAGGRMIDLTFSTRRIAAVSESRPAVSSVQLQHAPQPAQV
jgi:hypothetical protein